MDQDYYVPIKRDNFSVNSAHNSSWTALASFLKPWHQQVQNQRTWPCLDGFFCMRKVNWTGNQEDQRLGQLDVTRPKCSRVFHLDVQGGNFSLLLLRLRSWSDGAFVFQTQLKILGIVWLIHKYYCEEDNKKKKIENP